MSETPHYAMGLLGLSPAWACKIFLTRYWPKLWLSAKGDTLSDIVDAMLDDVEYAVNWRQPTAAEASNFLHHIANLFDDAYGANENEPSVIFENSLGEAYSV